MSEAANDTDERRRARRATAGASAPVVEIDGLRHAAAPIVLTERQRGALGVVSRRELEEAGLRAPKLVPPACVACGAEDLKALTWSIGPQVPPLTRCVLLCETCLWYVRAEVIAEHEARDVETVRAELVKADELAGTRCRACGAPASSAWQHAANPERSIALCAPCARSLESGQVARELRGGA